MSVERQRQILASSGATLSLKEAQLTVMERITTIKERASDVFRAVGKVQEAVQSAELALAKARLEGRAGTLRSDAEFAISQYFHATAFSTAFAETEAARKDAADVMRTLELAYATSLPELQGVTRDKVKSPSLWANQFFDLDMSPLRVRGDIPVSTAPTAEAFQSDKVEGYAQNLLRLAEGLLGARDLTPVPSVKSDIILPGPAATREISVTVGGETFTDKVPSEGAAAWVVECPATSACAPAGGSCQVSGRTPFDRLCAKADGTPQAPRSARLRFDLDPYGGLTRDGSEPASAVT